MQTHSERPSLRGELRATVKLATPLALAQMGMLLMSTVDTAIVSRYDATHAAGVTLGIAITHGLLGFGMGFSMALEPLMAQAYGANEEGRMWGWWRLGLKTTLAVSVILASIALILASLTHHAGIDPEIRDRGFEYVLARTPANLVMLLWMTARSFLQSRQMTRALLVGALIANIFNLIADLALVDGIVTWGSFGAGIATSVSTVALTSVLIFAVSRHRPHPDTPIIPGELKLLLRLSFPLGLQLAAEFLVFSACGILATRLGAIEGNAHQIALQCTTLSFMAAVGIAGATASRVGQAIGQKRADLASLRARTSSLLVLFVMGSSAIFFAAFAAELVGLFNPAEVAVRDAAIQLLYIAAIFQLFDGMQALLSGVLRGLGDLRFPFIITASAYWLIGFPVAAFLAFPMNLGLEGLWYGLTAGLFASAAGLIIRYFILERRGFHRLQN